MIRCRQPAFLACLTGLVLAAPALAGEQRISNTEGNLTATLAVADHFGDAIAALGDWDGDNVEDIAVGVSGDDDGGLNRGAVYILFLNTDGTVKAEQKISSTSGGFGGALANGDGFGRSVTNIGDLDNDGDDDLMVGAPFDATGGLEAGAVWILFMNSNGTVSGQQKISKTEGASGVGTLPMDDFSNFGWSGTLLGDLDGNGVANEVAIGARGELVNGETRGSVYVMTLDDAGTWDDYQRINTVEGNFTGVVDANDRFGSAVAAMGDIDGDSITDMAVGAPNDDDGGTNQGAVWILRLNSDGTVKNWNKISAWTVLLTPHDLVGEAIASVGDLNGDGVGDLAVGAPGTDGSAPNTGGLWLMFLDPFGALAATERIYSFGGGFNINWALNDQFGYAVASIGDLDDDTHPDLSVGVPWDDDGASAAGSVWTLFTDTSQYAAATAFDDLGGALPGTNDPKLGAAGDLLGGDEVFMHLTGALSGGTTHLVAGLTQIDEPFKGGIMVPKPTLILFNIVADSNGVVDLEFIWPTGLPSGFCTFNQFWIEDDNGPAGFAASNGLKFNQP